MQLVEKMLIFYVIRLMIFTVGMIKEVEKSFRLTEKDKPYITACVSKRPDQNQVIKNVM